MNQIFIFVRFCGKSVKGINGLFRGLTQTVPGQNSIASTVLNGSGVGDRNLPFRDPK